MVLSLNRWNGKVAVVTGVSSGIGVAIAEQLVGSGVIVVGVARRIERLEELARKLSGKKGKLYPFKADFSKEGDILKTFEWTTKNVGPVHILINNAGVIKLGSLSDGKSDDWRDVFNLNVLGLSIATREAIKIMKSNSINGHIIHVNSIAGHKVAPSSNVTNVYSASKHAVTALTETLRNELVKAGSKIKVSSVSPGLVATEMVQTFMNAGIDRSALDSRPVLKPEDIADGVVYALSTPEHVQVHELTIKPVGEPY